MSDASGWRLASLTVLLVIWGAAGNALGAAYRILDLGTLGGTSSVAYGINNSGQVVGRAATPSGDLHAFRTAPNQPIDPSADDLGAPGGNESWASGINANGQVAGYVGYAEWVYVEWFDEWAYIYRWMRAFRTAPDQPINPGMDYVGTLQDGLSWATGINDSGQVVGNVGSSGIDGTESWNSFRTAPNQPINPTTDVVNARSASAINASGQVVGQAWSLSGEIHAYRTAPNQPLNRTTDDLGTLGGHSWKYGGNTSEAYGINTSGQAVGWAVTPLQEAHAFRTGPRQPINPATDDLGTLGGDFSEAYGINDDGQVVGTSGGHAFVYSDNGPMQDLNGLIDATSGWVLESARGINDLGQIVGGGIHDGNHHAFLLTPIPEPAALVLSGIAAGLIALARQWRHSANDFLDADRDS